MMKWILWFGPEEAFTVRFSVRLEDFGPSEGVVRDGKVRQERREAFVRAMRWNRVFTP